MASARPPSTAFLLSLAVLLSLLHAVLALTAVGNKSVTADEIAHLTGGHTYNTRHDFRLQPENGNLTQRVTALPLLAARAPLPAVTLPSWQSADVWSYSHAFFYEQGLSIGELLFLGRVMIALVSAATALLVFFWSRALFGWRGGFLSLALFVFCPAFLAHGALATSDVMMTFFFVAVMGAWWRHLENPGIGGAALSAIVLGLAFVAKFSAVLLLPMLALTAVIWAAPLVRATGWRPPIRRLARTTLVHAVATWAIIWLFYGFRFSAFPPGAESGAHFLHGWTMILTDLGAAASVIQHLRDWHFLPEAWLYGFAFVLQFSQERSAFFNGEYSTTGWVGFFPFAFLVKTTLPLLLLLALGVVLSIRRLAATGAADALRRLRPLTPLAALALVYGATSLASHLNIGHRHILPLYPVLFIVAGWLGRWLDFRQPIATVLVGGLALWHAGESWRARPHYLASFNQIVGGPKNGWRHLVDSSLDWGQDLPELKSWLDRNAAGEKVFLSYFGTGYPRYEGIVAESLPSMPGFGQDRRPSKLLPGIYAISATMLQQVYSSRELRTTWSLPLEAEFQKLHAREPELISSFRGFSSRSTPDVDASLATWRTTWKRYDALRFARLAHYLRVRRPDTNAGFSILIYRLSSEEISAATGSLAEWSALIERAAGSSP